MRKILIGLLGYTFVSQQVSAQTDSIASRHELKNVTVKATNGNRRPPPCLATDGCSASRQ
jgi:hypothetical protein